MVAAPDGGAQQEQDYAGEGKDPVHAEVRCNQTAEQWPCHRANLLGGKEHAEDASLV